MKVAITVFAEIESLHTAQVDLENIASDPRGGEAGAVPVPWTTAIWTWQLKPVIIDVGKQMAII